MAKPKKTPTQVVRAVRLLQRLQGRTVGLRLDDLADELKVSRSQVRRDLLALEEAGIRLVFETEEGRYGKATVRILDADTADIPLTRRERYTLLAARRLFDVFRDTPWFEDIESIYDKLIETLSSKERKDLKVLSNQIVYLPAGGTKDYQGSKHIIDALQTSVMMLRPLKYKYKPRFGPSSQGTMQVYAFVLHRNGLYVAASRLLDDDNLQEPRVFAVERFEKAEPVRGKRITPPADLDVESLFDGAFGLISGKKTHHVVVELARAAKADAESRQWHRTQEIFPLANGRTRVEFTVSTLREVIPWVLEWGTKARVVGSSELRRKVRAALRASLAQYDD